MADGQVGLAAALRAVCRQLRGAFTLVVTSSREPGLVVAARRNSPLVVGLGDGESFVASDVAAFIAHTREALEIGQDEVVELRGGGVTVTDFDGLPAQGRPFHVDWDASAAEKGGYPYFMLKEISEQPQALADTLRGRLSPKRADRARRAAPRSPGVARCRQGLHRRVWHCVPRRDDRQVRHRTLDPAAVRGRAGQRVPLPRPGARPWHPRHRDQPERRDARHVDGRQARPRAERPGAGGLQLGRLHDPARIRRGALHPLRARGRGRRHQDIPRAGGGLPARRAVPRPGARGGLGRRGHRAGGAAAAHARSWSPGRSTPSSRCGRWPASSPTPKPCSSSAATSATRWRWKVR